MGRTAQVNSVAATPPRMRFRCPQCPTIHDGLPAIAFRLPDVIHGLSAAERAVRALVTADLAILDDRHFFIRGLLRIPVRDYPETLDFGPWVELGKEDFARYALAYMDGANGEVRSTRGHIANGFATPATLSIGLAVTLDLSGSPSQRPQLTLVEPHHPLASAQRRGIELERAIEIAANMPGFVVLVG